MSKKYLHILVDSREASVTFTRAFYKEVGRPELGMVEHCRPVDFASELQSILKNVKPGDVVIIATHFIPDDQLKLATSYIEESQIKPESITIASYASFKHIRSWCDDNKIKFRAIEYGRRKISSKASTNISKYLKGKLDGLNKNEQLALERIWVQYRLILSIISRLEDLGKVTRELIAHQNDGKKKALSEFGRALRYHKLGEPDMAGGSYSSEHTPPNLIDQLRDKINYVAATDYSVLVRGESGSGKETTAWAIHELSARRDKPFMVVNCAGFTDDLLESEMFGYAEGSHSTAFKDYTGIMEQVNGGTLFLDELPDMGHRVQAKLMRCLETGEFRPLGSTENKYSDVRIIAAGQTDLINDARRLRPDLKSRIGQLSVTVHSLRENEEQFPGTVFKLAYVLLERYTWETVFRKGRSYELSPVDIKKYQYRLEDEAVMKRLSQSQWKESNIRELNNFIRHWLVFGDQELSTISESKSSKPVEPDCLKDALQGELLLNYLELPSSRKEMQDFFNENSFNDIKRAYMSYVFKIFSQMVEDENRTKKLDTKPTQKALAKLIGITENTMSRYRN
jgi:DNA-binding NtrC family response regulator